MAGPGDRPPLFVPRNVARYEDAARRIARRTVGPIGRFSARAMAFADRLVDGWTGAVSQPGESPVTAASLRLAPESLAVLRPWYEQEDPVVERLARREKLPGRAREPEQRSTGAAERGLALPRTVLGPVAERDPARGREPIAEREAAPATFQTGSPDAASGAPVTAEGGGATLEAPAETAAVRATASSSLPQVSSLVSSPASTTVGDPKAAEWLGLRQPASPPPERPRAVASTPLARVLAHAAWADERLGVSAETARSDGRTQRGPAGYVWVAPPTAEEAHRPAPVAVSRPTVTPAIAGAEAGAIRDRVLPGSAAAASTAAPSVRPSLLAASGLPELGVVAALPRPAGPLAAASSRLAGFLDQLVGTRVAREAAPLPLPIANPPAPLDDLASAGAVSPAAMRAPGTEYLRGPEPARARESAQRVGGRAEQNRSLAASSSAESGAAPSSSPSPSPSPSPSATLARAPSSIGPVGAAASPAQGASAELEAAGSLPPPSQSSAGAKSATSSAGPAQSSSWRAEQRAGGAQPFLRPGAIGLRAEQLGSVVDARVAASWGEPSEAPSLERAVRLAWVAPSPTAERAGEEARPQTVARPRGMAAVARFLDGLAGVEAARATSPRPVDSSGAEAPLVARVQQSLRAANPGELVRDTSGRELVRDASGRELVRDASARERARDAGRRESVRDAGGREWVRAAPAREWVRAVESPARPGAVGAVSALAGGEQRATTSVRPDAASEMDLGAPREGSSRRGPAEAANEGLRPGGLGARAEQLAGQLGVRAAGLSIDFIDPAGLSALMSGELAYLQPPAGSEKSAAIGARRAAGSSGSSRAISPEEWALVATFPSVATAAQVAGARRAGSWAAGAGSLIRTLQAPAQTLLSASAGGAFGGGSAAGIFERQLAGAQSMEIGGASMALSGGGPLLSASGGEPARAPLSTVDLPRDLVAPTVIATDRARLPSGRAPRGSYTWPRAAQSEIGAGAAPRMVAVGAQAEETGERAMQGAPPWRARPVVLAGGAEAPAGPAGAALALARPFFEIIRGGLSPSEPGSAGQSVGRAALPQPLVSAAPAGEAAARMIQAVRQPPATAPSDDRVTLADLTLISVASASQQVAAAEAGGAPAPAPTRPTDSSSSGGAPQSHGPAPAKEDIEELAREVFNELQRLVEIARERSGDPWES